MAWESPLRSGFKSHSHKRLTFVFTGESGYTLAFANRIAHSGSQGETGVFRMGALSLPSDCFVRFGNPAWPGVRTANFAALCTGGVCGKEAESLLDIDARTVRRCPEATRSRRNAQPRCWFLCRTGELHGLPSLCRNSGESFHAPCCADSFICALCRSVVLSNAVSCRS